MSYNRKILRRIYNRTTGKCHICGKKLSLKNYSKRGATGAWEVEHSRPRSKGGTNNLNNLYAACISCNRSKGVHTTQTARAQHNRTRAPLSKVQRENAKCSNAFWGALILGLIGWAVAGPFGIAKGACALVGGALGGKIGYDTDPDS